MTTLGKVVLWTAFTIDVAGVLYFWLRARRRAR